MLYPHTRESGLEIGGHLNAAQTSDVCLALYNNTYFTPPTPSPIVFVAPQLF